MGIPKKRPLKILWHGEFGFTTGFAGVSENIVDRLFNVTTDWGTKKFLPAVQALGMGVNPFDGNDKKPYKVIPKFGNDQFGQDTAKQIVEQFRPDIVVTFGDTWMADFWNDEGVIPPDLRKTFKLVGYIAIDGYPIPEFWVDKYAKFDKVITFTNFGKEAIDERARLMGRKLNTSFIHHGVDPQVFRPHKQSDVEDFKKSRGLEGKKVIGMFSRNQPRKHHPEFIELAQQILKATDNDPDIRFYLHSVEIDAGWNLPALIKDINELRLRERFQAEGAVHPGQEIPEITTNLKDRFIFPGITNPALGYPTDLLNMMYNICDAHVLCTSGEGFGCTLLESMSAGVPTFTNDYAAGAELIRESGGGEVIKAREYTFRGSDHNFYRPHMDYEDAVAKILPVIQDPEVRKKYSKRARAFALSLSWDFVIEDWDRELSSVYDLKVSEPHKAEVL